MYLKKFLLLNPTSLHSRGITGDEASGQTIKGIVSQSHGIQQLR